jgi:hypothetical protein
VKKLKKLGGGGTACDDVDCHYLEAGPEDHPPLTAGQTV